MNNLKIDVIATTISGSIKDWGKIKHIVPLFQMEGFTNVNLFTADSHAKARKMAKESVLNGCRTLISAGGSGTFNAVLEGCIDSEVDPQKINLGFLRKGSADLIGKTLGMPDEINDAIAVFSNAIRKQNTKPCDILCAKNGIDEPKPRHFVGYGGAAIFGNIPLYTENRFIKYYKGILSQLFGDMGPFFVGASIAVVKEIIGSVFRKKKTWKVSVDGKQVAQGPYRSFIIVNGDLGKNLPLAKDVPLGSGDFHLFALRDIGILKIPGQFKQTWKATVQKDPERWGFEQYQILEQLVIETENDKPFYINVDGSAKKCDGSAVFSLSSQINLLSGKK